MLDWPAGLDAVSRLSFWTIVVGCLANGSSALLGCFLVLRRMSMLGDALSHAILPGLVIAFLLTSSVGFWPMFLGAIVFAMLTAGLANFLSVQGHASEEAGLGIVFSSFFALGIVLVQSLAENVHLDRDAVLEGAIEYVPLDLMQFAGLSWPATFWPAAIVFVAVLFWIVLFWKELKASTFDPGFATAIGFHGHKMLATLVILVSVAIVASFKIVGSILVVAMLVVPGATAQLLTHRLDRMLGISVVVAVFSTTAGYFWAWHANTSASAMMAVVCGFCFLGAFLFSPHQGLLMTRWQQLQLRRRIQAEDVLGICYRWEERQSGEKSPQPITVDQISSLVGGNFWPRTLVKLERDSLLEVDSLKRYRLTPAGKQRGQRIVRGHRLWESFLDTEFQLPEDHLHEAAHQMEHYLDQESRERIEQELGSPIQDPHGRQIPPRADVDPHQD